MSGLFKRPKVEKPAPMPDENDPAARAARRRVYEEASMRSGRQSTMLSDSYGNNKLGGQG